MTQHTFGLHPFSRACRGWMLAVLCALVSLACSPAADAPAGSAPGGTAATERELDPAQAFELQSLDGGKVALADLAGKTVVLDFWATWCPPCEFQVPELNAFYDAHAGDPDVAVYGISVDTDGPEVVSAWTEQKDVHYPILIGGEDLARKYGALGFPTLYVITPDGQIHSKHVGLIESADLEEALRQERARSL